MGKWAFSWVCSRFPSDKTHKLTSSTGSGSKLHDTVRVTIERTLKLLSQQLSSKYPQSPPNPSRDVPPKSIPRPAQSSASAIQHQPTAYPAYEPSNNGIGTTTQRPNGHVPTFVDHPPAASHPTEVTYQDPSQFQYQNQYPRDSTAFEQSYVQPDTLPATAAAATAFMTSYQQPQASTTYAQNPAFLPASSNYGPGSPSAWRQFTGDIASNIDPTTDYLSSASALMQLGRNGGSSSQMPIDLNAQQGGNINGEQQQSWPFLIFDNGHSIG